MTVPICLYVSISLSRRGLNVVKPAAVLQVEQEPGHQARYLPLTGERG
jgi:hypothetical protein